jgi:hypothetical protein
MKTNQNCVREALGAQKRGGAGGRGGGEGERGVTLWGGGGKAHTQRDASVSEGFRGFRVDVVGLVSVHLESAVYSLVICGSIILGFRV